MRRIIFHIVIFSLFAVTNSQAQDALTPPDNPNLGIDEKLNSYIPDNVVLKDKDGNEVNLKDLIDKPTFLSFIYFECPGLCNPLLDGIAEIIDLTELEMGKDYQMITVSMNKDDTPELGAKKKKNYVAAIQKDINEEEWIWLTGDSTNIHKITNATGFGFQREGNDFIHGAVLIALSPDGKITRYLYPGFANYGTGSGYFLPFDFKMATVEALKGKASPTFNRVLRFCFSYDPQGKQYVFNVTKVSGTIILSLALVLFFVLLLKKKKTVTQPNDNN